VTKIFGLFGEEVTGDWTKLRNEGLNDLYCSPACVILVIESRRGGIGETCGMNVGKG